VFTSFIVSFLVLYRQYQAGPLNPSNIVGFIFFGNCAVICVLFYTFSMKFNVVMERWSLTERAISKFNFAGASFPARWSLKKRIYVCTVVGLGGALGEHLMSLASQTQRVLYETRVCNWTKSNFVEDFITKHLYFTFSVFDYTPIIGLISEYFNVSFTFYWSFVDIFIMIISIGIAFNYEQVNTRIEFFRERSLSDETWSEVRRTYNEISVLLNFVSESMDKLILVACFNDAYFIMVQLLNITT
jgi:gustatory receptor